MAAARSCFARAFPTVRDDYDATLRDIAGLVAQAEVAAGETLLPVGIGIPGTISRKTGWVKNANSTWLNGKPFPKRPVSVFDARCQSHQRCQLPCGFRGHRRCGVAVMSWYSRAFSVLVAVRVLPIKVNRLLAPMVWRANGGTIPLAWTSDAELNARPCYCGKAGCQEAFLSGTGLVSFLSNRDWPKNKRP